MGMPMVGGFAHRGFEIRWTCGEDAALCDGYRWALQTTLGDITVRRQFPHPLSRDAADTEARSVAPELLALDWP